MEPQFSVRDDGSDAMQKMKRNRGGKEKDGDIEFATSPFLIKIGITFQNPLSLWLIFRFFLKGYAWEMMNLLLFLGFLLMFFWVYDSLGLLCYWFCLLFLYSGFWFFRMMFGLGFQVNNYCLPLITVPFPFYNVLHQGFRLDVKFLKTGPCLLEKNRKNMGFGVCFLICSFRKQCASSVFCVLDLATDRMG